jgi:hypothetical protein
MPTCPSRPAPEPGRDHRREDLERLRPDPAERARTVAARAAAAVCAAGIQSSRVLAHAVTTAGQTLLVVPRDGDLASAVRTAPAADLSALLMVSDRAPVPLRNPVRAQLWLSGWLTPVRPHDERAASVAFAEVQPAEVLLDIGRSATLLRLDLAEVVLGENRCGIDVGPADFLAARPDPLAAMEADLLRHLDRDHPDFLALLGRLLPAGVAGAGDVLRPLGIDRFGVRLRVERARGFQDLRVPFVRPLTRPVQLGAAFRQLTCVASARG